jgi:hypothetical protein
MKTLKLLFGALCMIAALNVQTAHAQVVYQDRAAFDINYLTANQENWDTYAALTIIPNGSTLNGITYNTTSGTDLQVNNFYSASSGSQSLAEVNNGFFSGSENITFTFAKPLSAFAIDINTFSSATGDYTANASNGDVINSYFDAFPNISTGEFIGFSDTNSFTSVTIEAPNGDGYTLDTLQYVDAPVVSNPSVVPEPNTVALMMVGLLAMAVFTLRRKFAFVA